MRIIYGLILALLTVLPLQATTAVTANLKSGLGTAYQSDAFVRFKLRNYSGNVPKVSGTGIIVEPQFDVRPDAAGLISTNIYGNYVISPAGTFYTIEYWAGGRVVASANYLFCTVTSGACSADLASADLNSLTPITTAPVVLPPTGDTTYARLDGGNQPFSGEILAPAVDKVQHASSFSGSDGCAKVIAATAALPSTGGVVDARGLIGNQTCTANPLSSGKDYIVLLGAATWTTDVQWQTPVGRKVRVLGINQGDAATGGTTIKASASFPTDGRAVVRVGGSTPGTATHRSSFENLTVDCNGVAKSGFFSADANEGSGLRHVVIANCPTSGFEVTSMAATGGAQNYTVDDVEIYPFSYGTASTVGGKITGNNSGPQQISNVTFVGNSGAASTNCFTIDKVQVGRFTSLHGEYCTNVVHVAPTNAVDGITLDNTNGGPGTTTVIRITNSSSQNIVALSTVLAGATNALVNVGTSKTITPASGKLALYVLGDGATKTEWSSYSATSSVINAPALLGNLNVNGNAVLDGTVNSASSGLVRLGTGQTVCWRNNANSADVCVSKNANDQIVLPTASITGNADAKRVIFRNGTNLAGGNFAFSGGWGASASIGTIAGTDQAFTFIMTSAGAGLAANPTVTLTFADGTWGVAPVCLAQRIGGTDAAPTIVGVTTTATTVQVNPVFTPGGGNATTVFNVICSGKGN